MSQAENLLKSLTDDEIAAYMAASDVEEHIIIGSDRFIFVPNSLRRLAVQFDHNIETVTFDCPRYWDGRDMSTMRVYINYALADGSSGTSVATDVVVDENDTNIIHFNWTLSKNATLASGRLAFLVCIKKTDADGNEVNHWNSEINTQTYISEGLSCAEPVDEIYPDIITSLLQSMSDLKEYVGSIGGENIERLEKEMDKMSEDIAELNDTVIAPISDDVETLKKQMAKLTYEDIVINFFRKSIGSTYELGTKIDAVTLSWATSKAPASIKLDGSSLAPNLTGIELSNLGLINNKTWTLTVTGDYDEVVKATTSVTFLNGVYYGVSDIPEEINSKFILSLSAPNLRSNKLPTFTVDAGVSEYIWYCIPSRFGSCIFTVGGFDGGFDLVATIKFTNASDHVENYDIYRSTNAALGNTTVEVK